MAEWWSIEILHGDFSAFQWQEAHDSELIEAALTNGALDGTSGTSGQWGVAFEVCFNTAEEWKRSAICRLSGPPWTRCPIRSTGC